MDSVTRHRPKPTEGRQATASAIGRGVARLFKTLGYAPLSEVALASGRRADLIGLSVAGELWLVEIKSCLSDFRLDHKWQSYRPFCDRFFFAVAPDFPHQVLPPDTGLIVADRYGGEILRQAPEHKLPAPRRRAITVRLARAAALSLMAARDPDEGLDGSLRG
ncbi:MAG TPA: MmcB family DNA repair protein [Hyphomicrobiaceae bacterium]|nr:MmcB family DNA repair protein [Hyphomicrobiaceae bacterium]